MANTSSIVRRRASRAALAVAAAALLVTGVTWRGLASDAQTATPKTVAAPPAAPAIAGDRQSYADVVRAVTPSVVTIRTERKAEGAPASLQRDDFLRRFFGDRFDDVPRMPAPSRRGLGSGVIVSADGYILTNHHVVEGADEILVDLGDGRTITATPVGADEPSDLALLKIAATDLRPLPIGNSDAVQVGDVVLAVGNPLGIGQTVTMGIVSAKGRSTGVGDGGYEDFLQTDAPINQGNSGGALVNTKGELIGINSQIISPSQGNIGIGFAIPANMVRHVMDELRTEGRVRRAQLGVTVQAVTSDLAASLGLKEPVGAIVSSVSSGSAADRAGVRRGDVIKALNGEPVHDTNALRNRVAESKPGSTATLLVVRDGAERTLTVKLDEAAPTRAARLEGEGGTDDKTALGVAVAPLTPEAASRAGVPSDLGGLIVQGVNPDGRAAAAGIRAGDVIVEVNRKPISTVEELRAAVSGASDRPLLVLVNRAGNSLFLSVKAS